MLKKSDVEVRESQIEDILVASPGLLKNLLNTPDLPKIIARQMQVPSGRLDLLLTSSASIQLVELKVAPFQKAYVKQVLNYMRDVRSLQESDRLIRGELNAYLLCTRATNEQKKFATQENVCTIVYDPSEVLLHYYQENKPIALFTDTRPIDLGIWNIHLIHDLLRVVSTKSNFSEVEEEIGGARQTLFNKIRFAHQLGLVDWQPDQQSIRLTELGTQYLHLGDPSSSRVLSEAQAELLRKLTLRNPFESSVILGIASIVEAVFVIAKNTYPVPMKHLIEYFAYHAGKFFDWAKPKARYNATHMYVNYGTALGLLAKIGDRVYLTPTGYRFTLYLQLHKGLKMVEAL